MPDVLDSTFDIVVDGHTYTFKIPSIKYHIEVGYKAADVRRRAFPEAGGALGTLDMDGVWFARYCAILELYLVKATTGWPYGIADDRKATPLDFANPPKVDFEKFPADCEQLVSQVGLAFETEKARFRSGRDTDRKSAGDQAVASQ
jgi:hypothetical protein